MLQGRGSEAHGDLGDDTLRGRHGVVHGLGLRRFLAVAPVLLAELLFLRTWRGGPLARLEVPAGLGATWQDLLRGRDVELASLGTPVSALVDALPVCVLAAPERQGYVRAIGRAGLSEQFPGLHERVSSRRTIL